MNINIKLKTMRKISLVLVAIMLVSLNLTAQNYTAVLSKSTVKWHAAKVTGEHWGTVELKSGSLQIEGDKITTGQFVMDMTTIVNEDLTSEEWNTKLIDHLKSDDFFSVEKFPTSKFVITKSETFKDGKAKVTGNLTIKGITNPVSFEATKQGNTFTAKITIDRTLYDIRYGSGKFFEDLGDKVINDNFDLTISLVLE
jgi:polyisoprenoid-binding protein YceI